jgi:hypothetical protein
MHRAHNIPALRNAPHTGQPLPVYRLSRRAALGKAPLSHVRHIGWKYPLIGGDECGLVFLAETHEGLRYAGINSGDFPRCVMDAAVLAERELHADERNYEPRLLEIPELKLYALWLRAERGKSRFVLLSEGIRRPSPRIQADIAPALLRAAAALRTPRSRSTSSSKTPTPPRARQRARGSS